jgi:hypothetical protein
MASRLSGFYQDDPHILGVIAFFKQVFEKFPWWG